MSTRKTELTESQQGRMLADLAHVDPKTIRAYIQGQITDPAEAERVEAHLFTCEECLTEYNRLFEAYSPLKADFDAIQAKRTQTPPAGEKWRLALALEHLASLAGEGRERLLRWRDTLLATEARYGASLNAFLQSNSRESYLKVLDTLSAPGLRVASAGSVKGARHGSEREPNTARRFVLVADKWLDVQVTVEATGVRLDFVKWSESDPPLVVLLPEAEDAEALLPTSTIPNGAGKFELRFTDVPTGSYLLSIAPL